MKNNPEVEINTSAQHYSYWMVDGMLYFNPGLMIMTGVGIYGFGGGAYHHMHFIDGSLPTNARMQSMAPRTPPGEILRLIQMPTMTRPMISRAALQPMPVPWAVARRPAADAMRRTSIRS